MATEATESGSNRRCQRCGAVIPAIQESCVACLVNDLKLMADQLFDPSPSLRGRLGGSDFTVLEEIGRGGVGVVFRARQTSPPRDVAIKVLQPHFLSTPDVRRRLFAEAAAMAELNHPGILPLYTAGEHDGQPWIAMKLATGGTLSARRGEWAGRWREIAELVAGLADAVQHAHERGLIHRDVKPGNVLFDENDHARLTDFGLVKWIDREASDTLGHAMLGTPAYLAPEVAQAGAIAATTASDIYGLGAILYELLTGARPYKGGATAEVLRRVATEEPPPPRRVNPSIPADLGTICQKALARTPGARYPTAADLAADLRRWMAGRVILARPSSTGEKVVRWARRNPLPASLAAALALSGVVGGIAITRQNSQLRRLNAELETSIGDVQIARNEAEERVDYMTHELPELLAPIGRTDVLDGLFRNLEAYYASTRVPKDARALAREAEFRTQWAQVLRPSGQSEAATRELDEAAVLGRQATGMPAAETDAWLASSRALRQGGEHAATLDDYGRAQRLIEEGIAVAEEGLRRFPGSVPLRVAMADALLERADAWLERGDAEDNNLAAQTLAPAPEEWRQLVVATAAGPIALHQHARRQEASAYFKLGRVLARLGDHPAAVENYRKSHAAHTALAADFNGSAEEKRRLLTACNRLAGELLKQTAEGVPPPFDEVESLLRKADELANALVQLDPANQRWRADFGLAAFALGHLEHRREDFEQSRRRIEETIERLGPVSPLAVPSIHDHRANAFGELAKNLAFADDVPAALEAWARALESAFENIKVDPVRWGSHSLWAGILTEDTGLREGHQPVEERERTLERWKQRVETEAGRQGASVWWQLDLAAVNRRLADLCAADPARSTEATELNRRAFLTRSDILVNEPRAPGALAADVAGAAKKLLAAAPTSDDRLAVAEWLTKGAPRAGQVEPKGRWRQAWSSAVVLAIEPLPPDRRAALAREARAAIFPPAAPERWSAEESQNLDRLIEFEKPG